MTSPHSRFDASMGIPGFDLPEDDHVVQRVADTHFARAERMFAALPLAHRLGPAFRAALEEMHQFDRSHGEDPRTLLTMLYRSTGRLCRAGAPV